MKRAPLLALLLCVGCPADRPTPTFDNPGVGPVEGGNGAGGSALTSVTVGVSTGTVVPVVTNCECIYELARVPGCSDCATVTGANSCALQKQACLANSNCATNLQTVCPTVFQDTDAATSVCANTAGADGTPLLQAYLGCICNLACVVECKGGQDCLGAGGAGGGP
jgi:hypothetical protein